MLTLSRCEMMQAKNDHRQHRECGTDDIEPVHPRGQPDAGGDCAGAEIRRTDLKADGVERSGHRHALPSRP